MKKILIALIFSLIIVLPAMADYWQITVQSWTKSPGPQLKHENVLVNGSAIPTADIVGGKCTAILPADSNNCVFKLATRMGQNVQIQSVDISDNLSPLHVVGNVGSGIAPASGGSVGWTWITE